MNLIQAVPNVMVTDLVVRNVAGQLRKTREAKAEPFGYQAP
jgi:hypothetical protein